MSLEFKGLQDFNSNLSENPPERFELIIRHYNQLLFRVGMGYLKEPVDVEDAMQNTWMKAFENLKTFGGKSKFSTWLCRIMINECLMAIRVSKNNRQLKMEEELSYSQSEDHAHTMTREQLIRWLEDALVEIPTEYRSVYIFREVEGMNTEETAELLNLSIENVKVRLHRARKMLKEKLIDRVPVSELFEYHRKYCDRLTASIIQKITGKL